MPVQASRDHAHFCSLSWNPAQLPLERAQVGLLEDKRSQAPSWPGSWTQTHEGAQLKAELPSWAQNHGEINDCHFKSLSFGAVCCAATDNWYTKERWGCRNICRMEEPTTSVRQTLFPFTHSLIRYRFYWAPKWMPGSVLKLEIERWQDTVKENRDNEQTIPK